LTVEEAFVARGAGVLVTPRITAEEPARGRFPIELRLPDGATREVQAELDVAHMRGPLPPFAMIRLHGITVEEVPVGTELWTVGDAESPLKAR
jgi:hypothetical protein